MVPLRPGLTPAELRQMVTDLQPELARLVDSTIEQWWSWHNGIVLGEPGTYPAVTLDGFCLCGLDRLLDDSSFTTDHLPTELRDNAFPISYNDMGRTYWLVKNHSDNPWYIAWEEKDHALTPPHGDPEGPPILFSQYLHWALDVDLYHPGPALEFPHTTIAQ